VVVLQTSRVEKSYWQSPALEATAVKEQMLLGLEQAGDTVLPELWLRKRLKPFVEDELPLLMKGRLAFVAHPGTEQSSPCGIKRPFILAVGPEGGFVPSEIEMLKTKGFKMVSLGCRPLRVEPALHMLLGRMMDF
jgi:RsmE family RNA methyltransferase